MMQNKVTIIKVTPELMDELHAISTETYALYFANCWEGDGLNIYMEEQFGIPQLQADIAGDNIDFYLIASKAQTVGYLKINYGARFADYDADTSCELEKMYLLPEFKGQKIGQHALHLLMDVLRMKKKKTLFLCALDTNTEAIAFYKKMGFVFHSPGRLKYPHFKESFRGLEHLVLSIPE